MVVILHNIRSLHNVGSIFRTADAAGVEKLYLGGITPAPIDRFGEPRKKLTKIALGAEKTVPWEATARSPRAVGKLLERLKKDGYKIVAVEQDKKSIPYYKLSAKGYKLDKLALVLGAEVSGLPKTILAKCDRIVEIPMAGSKESLNVSVAFGIIVFHALYH